MRQKHPLADKRENYSILFFPHKGTFPRISTIERLWLTLKSRPCHSDWSPPFCLFLCMCVYDFADLNMCTFLYCAYVICWFWFTSSNLTPHIPYTWHAILLPQHTHACTATVASSSSLIFLFLYLFWMMWSFVKYVKQPSVWKVWAAPIPKNVEQVGENAVISTFFFKITVENMNMKPVSYSSILNPYEVLQ